MRQVIVYTTNKEYSHFVELARNMIYVKKIETDEEPTKEEIVSNLKKGFEGSARKRRYKLSLYNMQKQKYL